MEVCIDILVYFILFFELLVVERWEDGIVIRKIEKFFYFFFCFGIVFLFMLFLSRFVLFGRLINFILVYFGKNFI